VIPRVVVLACCAWFSITARADLLVSSFNNGRVFRFNEHTGVLVDTFVSNTNGLLNLPHGLAFGPDGNLYVASAGNDSILKYDGTNGGYLGPFVLLGMGGLDYPVWLEFRGGSLFVSSQLNDSVLRYNATNGAFISAFVSTNDNGGLDGPSGMAWGPDGHLYVVGRFGDHVMRFDGTNGNFLNAFVPAGAGGLSQPFGCHFGADGHLYVVSGNNSKVARFDGTNGTYLGDFVVSVGSGLAFPIGLEFGPGGALFVASFSNHRVVRFDGTTGARLNDFVSGVTGLSGPNFMRFHDFGPPKLDAITRAGTNVVISWRGRTDTQLQFNTDLSQTNWQPVAGTLGANSATNQIATNAVFYRLIRD
jgi:DNA-binding beta-propeller fold protein YncE